MAEQPRAWRARLRAAPIHSPQASSSAVFPPAVLPAVGLRRYPPRPDITRMTFTPILPGQNPMLSTNGQIYYLPQQATLGGRRRCTQNMGPCSESSTAFRLVTALRIAVALALISILGSTLCSARCGPRHATGAT